MHTATVRRSLGFGAMQLQLRPSMSKATILRQQRWNSANSGPGTQDAQKEISPHVGFYKTFARPVAKVLLMATFTYQLLYWGWVKLETDEVRKEKNAEVKVLQEQLANLTKKDKTSS